MAMVPASSAETYPAGVAKDDLVWVETIPGGDYVTRWLARGTHLRLTDLRGDGCAHVVVYNASQPIERLSVADTVKVMWNAYLGLGQLLLSDQGRVLASIVADTSRHHDTMTGPSTRVQNDLRYGSGAPESASPAGRELLVLAGAKHGLEPRDLPASISLFQSVEVRPDGALVFVGSAGPDCYVEIIAEMDLIVLIANAPHLLDPREEYICSPVNVEAWRGDPTHEHDGLFDATPEGNRAFLNTLEYLKAKGIR